MEVQNYTNKLKILVFPTDNNPYQKLLYGSGTLNKQHVIFLNGKNPSKLDFLFAPILFYPRVMYYRIIGFNLIHIHWIPFAVPLPSIKYNNILFRLLSSINLFFSINLLKILRFKIVWTFHNIKPHELVFLNNTRATRFMAISSDVLISHTQAAKQEFLELGIPEEKIKVIPHGNYLDFYKNTISKEKARYFLQIQEEAFCLLFFGQVRAYKGIEHLAKAIENLNEYFLKKSNNVVLIVGKCSDDNTIELLNKITEKYNVKFINKYVKDDEIQNYMNASDVVILPFRKITTSGSLILANSFKKAVIAPLLGPILELPSNTGFYYQENLEDMITYVLNNPLEVNTRSLNAYELAKSLNWEKIAIATERLYRELL